VCNTFCTCFRAHILFHATMTSFNSCTMNVSYTLRNAFVHQCYFGVHHSCTIYSCTSWRRKTKALAKQWPDPAVSSTARYLHNTLLRGITISNPPCPYPSRLKLMQLGFENLQGWFDWQFIVSDNHKALLPGGGKPLAT
jgi:hypothetical protein